ncbi:hypothetical protein DVH24_001890 [Malus domestica]|uniref:PLAC8 motif-containing protein n=1 Tax=Malus domestica TaxID=3750 RepID=A0A498I840_MALDO|nr:hypothetical protein DVH24_001890 [Malus domestica]
MNILNRMGLKSEWSSGLFGCGNEYSTCCITYFCPCVTFGRIAEIVDEGKSFNNLKTNKLNKIRYKRQIKIHCCVTNWSLYGRFGLCLACCGQGCTYCGLMLFGLQWLYSCFYRQKLRAKYNLPDKPCCDCGVHFFCDSCALCQEHAELKDRGLDPAKGYFRITMNCTYK